MYLIKYNILGLYLSFENFKSHPLIAKFVNNNTKNANIDHMSFKLN